MMSVGPIRYTLLRFSAEALGEDDTTHAIIIH